MKDSLSQETIDKLTRDAIDSEAMLVASMLIRCALRLAGDNPFARMLLLRTLTCAIEEQPQPDGALLQ